MGERSNTSGQDRKFTVGIAEPGYADHRVESELLEPFGAEVRFLR